MSLKLITAASTYPITLADARLHCKVDTTDDDTLITGLIIAASEMAEQYTGRALTTQTWEVSVDQFPVSYLPTTRPAIELTRAPVASVASVKYLDLNNTLQTLDPSQYTLDNADDFGVARVVPAPNVTWPSTSTAPNAVQVRYVAGYSVVPEPIRQWIRIAVSTMYKFRESTVIERATLMDLPYVDRLLDRYKIWKL